MIPVMTNHRGSLSRISDTLPKLSGVNQKIALYILNAPQETINLTITELGSQIGVSDASIVRFAKALGFSGFHAMKIRLAEDIVSPLSYVHEDLSPDDPVSVAVQKVMTMGLRALEDSLQLLDAQIIERAIGALARAQQIVLLASGNSIPIAMDLNFRLTKIGLQSRYSADATLQEMQASLLSAADVALGISHTGSSKDTVHALELAQAAGATTIGMTNHSESPLTRYASLCLLTTTRLGHFREERLDSNLSMQGLAEALAVGISIKRSSATEDAVTKTLNATAHRKY